MGFRIVSQVLGWDKRELRKRSEKIEKCKDAPPKEVRDEIKDWIGRSREEHEECRRRSKEQGMSIVSVILALSSHSVELTETQHAKALEYLSLQLAIRDRQEIVRVLCHHNPDHLTTAVRDAVDAYTPMIRHVHQAVNLSDTVWDFERFTTDMLKMSKSSGPKGEEKPPTVEDYVDLLHRHMSSSHKFLHQVAKNGKEVTGWWREYVQLATAQFRRSDGHHSSSPSPTAATKPPNNTTTTTITSSLQTATSSTATTPGAALRALQTHFTTLPAPDRAAITAELDAHATYLHDLHSASAARIAAVIRRTRSTPFGPGAYLARWQQLLDATPISPATAEGSVRYGGSRSVREAARRDVDGGEVEVKVDGGKGKGGKAEKMLKPPGVERTVGSFGKKFREVLAEGC